jgi:Ca-activated chloride channel family protein
MNMTQTRETRIVRKLEKAEQGSQAELAAAGIGALRLDNSDSTTGNLPLRELHIRSRVSGVTCQTRITQVFRNPHPEFLEATYIFPLPGRMAVADCTMRVQDRTVVAELQERSQARANYRQAIADGHQAAVAEEDRSETFTLRVGNIPSQQEVTIDLTLVGDISLSQGEGLLRMPLVVAPRYVPGHALDGPPVGAGVAADTDQVPDASCISPATLLPGFPHPVRFTLEVDLMPTGVLSTEVLREGLRCSLHTIVVSQSDDIDPPLIRVRLEPGERLNRDFILRFPVLPPTVQASLNYVPAGTAAGVWGVTVFPPAEEAKTIMPRDVIFLIDRSGSMDGWKMVAARRAVARMIDSLSDADRFRVIAFDSELESPLPGNLEWQEATDRNRWQVAEWIAGLQARGGTELGSALVAALRPLGLWGLATERDTVVVLITDGQVGAEDSILRSIESLRLPRLPRMLALGIDRAVNFSILQRLVALGGGSCEVVESEQQLDEVLQQVHHQLRWPVLRDVVVESLDSDLPPQLITPQSHRDVYSLRPLMILGRCLGNKPSISVRVSGRLADGALWQQTLTSEPTVTTGCAEQDEERKTLLARWGRGRVRELEDLVARGTGDSVQLRGEIVSTSLEAHVLSRFTAYVAVDSAEVVNPGGVQHAVTQPVEAPEGWKSSFIRAKRGPMFRVASPADSSQPSIKALAREVEDSSRPALRRMRGIVVRAGDSDEDSASLFCDYPAQLASDILSPPAKLFDKVVDEVMARGASHVYFALSPYQVTIDYVVRGKIQRHPTPVPAKWHQALLARIRRLAHLTKLRVRLQQGFLPERLPGTATQFHVYVVYADLDQVLVMLRVVAQPLSTPADDWRTLAEELMETAASVAGQDAQLQSLVAALRAECGLAS